MTGQGKGQIDWYLLRKFRTKEKSIGFYFRWWCPNWLGWFCANVTVKAWRELRDSPTVGPQETTHAPGHMGDIHGPIPSETYLRTLYHFDKCPFCLNFKLCRDIFMGKRRGRRRKRVIKADRPGACSDRRPPIHRDWFLRNGEGAAIASFHPVHRSCWRWRGFWLDYSSSAVIWIWLSFFLWIINFIELTIWQVDQLGTFLHNLTFVHAWNSRQYIFDWWQLFSREGGISRDRG